MHSAFLFPGQGSQSVGMAQDLLDVPQARARLDTADALLGFSLTDIMFGASEAADATEALKQTENTQPALYVHSLAAMAVLDAHDVTPAMVAGHSLGEYSALAAAGALSFEEGLRLVRLRGTLMASAGNDRPGTMAAVLNLDDEAVDAVCAEATTGPNSLVQSANFNAPGQVVISGDVDAVERAMEIASEKGARRVVPLPVSGAFHSPLMEEARGGLAEALEAATFKAPRCPVYLNVTAAPTTDPEAIRDALLQQLTSPVRWSQTLRAMQADGAERFVEVGAGRVLSGLVRRTLGRDVETITAGTVDELRALAG